MDMIENRTFDEIELGDTASLGRTLSREDIDLFAIMSGDVNPTHVDEEYAKSDMFHKIIAHGMWGASLISTLLGTKLPGPGTIYLGQTLCFHHPVALGDRITVTVTATAKEPEKHLVIFDCQCNNQRDEVVISGSATVIAPTTKVKRPRTILPEVHLHEHGVWYRYLLDLTSGLEPIRTAVVHPVDSNALLGAIEAAYANWHSITQCRWKLPARKASSPRSLAKPTSWSCPTWRRVTCWSSNWSIWPRHRSQAL